MTDTRLQSSVTQQHGNDRPRLKPCQMWDISCTAAPKREVGTLSFPHCSGVEKSTEHCRHRGRRSRCSQDSALTLHPLTAHPQHLYPEAQALIYMLYAEQGDILVLSVFTWPVFMRTLCMGSFGDSHLWIKETDSESLGNLLTVIRVINARMWISTQAAGPALLTSPQCSPLNL